MESALRYPVLPLAYPVGPSAFAERLCHINCKVTGRSILKLDEDRDSISDLARSPSADSGLLLEKIRSHFSLWRAFCVFAENGRGAVKSIGPVVFRWYVPSLDREFSSPIVRFETACLCSLYVSASLNAGFEGGSRAKELFLSAYRIGEGIWKHELLSWTLRKEKELPFEAALSGCASASAICLLALQRRAVSVVCKRIEKTREVSYDPGVVPNVLIAGIRLCFWWYVASDRLSKTLASRRSDYSISKQLEIARSHRASSFWLLFYFSALTKERQGKYDECVVFAEAISSPEPEGDEDPPIHSRAWIAREAARMRNNNDVIWLAKKSAKGPWELLPCDDGIFVLEEEAESLRSAREEFGENEMRRATEFLLKK